MDKDIFFNDDLFVKAAEGYPLYTKTADWNRLKNRLDGKTYSFGTPMKALVQQNPVNKNYWKRYPVHVQPEKIERAFSSDLFTSQGKQYELLHFYKSASAVNLLISPGSGMHAFVFAELGYMIHRLGFNVFIMPKHGGSTLKQLVQRHEDAVDYINAYYQGDVHLYGEGVGGLIIFHLALSGKKSIQSITCENSPAVFTDKFFHEALENHKAAGRRKALLLPVFGFLAKFFPWWKVPLKTYLRWDELVDNASETNRQIEKHLIKAFADDPDFDRQYSLKAVMSFINTPLPHQVSALAIPSMFVVTKRDIIPSYFKNIFHQLTIPKRRLFEAEGSAFRMFSNPEDAALLIANWITHQKNQVK